MNEMQLPRFGASAQQSPLLVIAILMLLTTAVGLGFGTRYGSVDNWANVLEQSTALALVALGQMLVVAVGGVDLSVGAMIGLGAVLASGLIDGDPSKTVPVSIGVIALITLVGIGNGLLIVLTRVHPLVVTLGTSAIITAAAGLYSLGPAGGVPESFSAIAYSRYLGVPMSPVAVALAFILMFWSLRNTAYGQHLLATGDDPRAARLIGLPVKAVIVLTYGASGLCCGLTSLYLVSRFGVGQPLTGAELTLGSITPVVLGGTALGGGSANVFGTLLATYLLSMINNLLNFLDVSTDYQYIVQGGVIIAAVTLYSRGARSTP